MGESIGREYYKPERGPRSLERKALDWEGQMLGCGVHSTTD